ncbi:DnaD domain protein [Cohnella sp. AR92]|uniref:DnaD domain protein n=1 Tax=Cohnella sp. AR92 TaxID=648716 RepID=UPI000F8ED382|nr:DnaD domain protein [Cohnella sp. AR92]RUS45962.1 helicase DnaB [Cohnella sp. AR92]
MRVSNRLEFTENHRYVACRDFALSGLDRTILSNLYQPMVGAFAVGLYMMLYHHLEDERVGYTVPEPQRRLLLGLGLELNDAGRKQLVENASKLEAVGLLQVFRQYDPAHEETLYEYVLLKPLSAAEFFTNLHLTLLLRDKVGKDPLLDLKNRFSPERPVGLARFMNREEITVPFYELFQLNAGPVDPELEAVMEESASATEAAASPWDKQPEKIRHSDMLFHFPRSSANRSFVERLHLQTESMAQINYLAYKFDLDVAQINRLLDENGIFETDGTLRWDELQYRANLTYRQSRKREEQAERYLSRLHSSEPGASAAPEAADERTDPAVYVEVPSRFVGKVTVAHYNRLLRTEPYTRMMERYFPSSVPVYFKNIFERINQNYKLSDPVVNVLFHYLIGMEDDQRLTSSFIDSIASNMLVRGIDTFEKAVAYVRSQEKLNETLERRRKGQDSESGGKAQGYGAGGRGRRGVGSGGGSGSRKPSMPVVGNDVPAEEVSAEEREKMRELARKLQDKNK